MNYDVTGMPDMPPLGEGTVQSEPSRRLSAIFRDLAGSADAPVTIGRIRDAMGDRSFAALLVLFSAINLIPLPPGSTLIFGPPLVLVSVQMLLGYPAPWLPQWLLAKSIAPERFRRASCRLVPLLERMERLVRPRYWPRFLSASDRGVGLVALVMAIAVTLPIPLGNWLPAFSIALIGLALSERDGVIFTVGLSVALFSLAIIGAVVGAAGMIASSAFGLHF